MLLFMLLRHLHMRKPYTYDLYRWRLMGMRLTVLRRV